MKVVVVFGGRNMKAQSQFSQTGLKMNPRPTLALFHALILTKVTPPDVPPDVAPNILPEIEINFRLVLA